MKGLPKIIILLFILTVVTVACSSNQEQTSAEGDHALTTLQRGLYEVTRLFHTTTTSGSTKDPAVPVLNPVVSDRSEAKEALLAYFGEELTHQILDHYLSEDTRGNYIILNATNNGAVIPFFGFNYTPDFNNKRFLIEEGPTDINITAPNNHVFTLELTQDNDYSITDFK